MRRYKLILCSLSLFYLLFLTAFQAVSGGNTVLENDFFRYEIDQNGQNLLFTDKATGRNVLKTSAPSVCSEILVKDEWLPVNAVALKGNRLEMSYRGVTEKVVLEVSTKSDRIALKVLSVPKTVAGLTIINVPLAVEGQPFEPFNACVLSMNLFTHVRQLPPLQTHLWARCYERFGLEGAEITLLGLPHTKMLPTVREVISHAPGIPPSKAGGAWAAEAKEGYGSYLMNFGTLTEETVEEWIETCKSLGFNQIDSHGGGGFFDFGTLELNQDKWPGGWDSFKKINARLRENGISHIFHTYAFFIDKTTRYVTPVPHKDLGYVQTFTLAEPITESATEITVNESTAHVSTVIGFHTENSVTLRIGDEFIEFSEVTTQPPFRFKGLKRGANGTHVSIHKKGEPARHMSERFGRFVPDPNSALFREVAHKHAEIVNDCHFDGIYLDAIDGAAVLGGEEDFWYYGTSFIFEIAKKLERDVGMEMSSMSHHWWHYRSRWQAWDRAVRGYKRFIDIHLASVKSPAFFLPEKIKSNEWEHGLWRGNTPLIDKFAGIDGGQTMLPLHLGWWGNQTWAPPQIEPTFPDDVEYLAVKMLANNAGYSQLGEVDKKTLEQKPLFRKAADIIRQYEKLRHENYFSDQVLEQLRQPQKEFTLVEDKQGAWTFKPRSYQKHKVLGHEHETKKWKVMNEFGAQPVKLRIEPLMSVSAYDDPAGILIADFEGNEDFLIDQVAEGVEVELTAASGEVGKANATGVFTALNSGVVPRDGAFAKAEKRYEKGFSLKDNQGIGVWIKGDGSGQLLNLSLRSPVHISHGAHGDHFVKIDFEGWKYFELVEIESEKISDYNWPDDTHFYVYDSYRHTISFDQIESFQLWYNDLPVGKQVKTVIGPVKALPLVTTSVTNPSVKIGNRSVVFPVTMEPGMYLELWSDDNCRLYDAFGKLLQDVKPTGEIPLLSAGENMLELNCESGGKVAPRIQVTVISEGKPLENAPRK